MKIKMLQSKPGAVNGGLSVKQFKVNGVYDSAGEDEITEELAQVFVKNKWAEPYEIPVVEGHAAQRRILQRNVSTVPENKMEKTVQENKTVNADFFKDWKAGKIRSWAAKQKIDLMDVPANTSASKLIEIVLEKVI